MLLVHLAYTRILIHVFCFPPLHPTLNLNAGGVLSLWEYEGGRKAFTEIWNDSTKTDKRKHVDENGKRYYEGTVMEQSLCKMHKRLTM